MSDIIKLTEFYKEQGFEPKEAVEKAEKQIEIERQWAEMQIERQLAEKQMERQLAEEQIERQLAEKKIELEMRKMDHEEKMKGVNFAVYFCIIGRWSYVYSFLYRIRYFSCYVFLVPTPISIVFAFSDDIFFQLEVTVCISC
jgi:hypothetical protein